MKILNLKSLTMALAVTFFFISCSDINLEFEKVEESSEELNLGGVPGEENDPSTITVELSNAGIVTDACVTYNSGTGMLEFADKDCFVQTYKAIVNHTDAALNTWEGSLAFTSLWSHYHALEADSTFDDWANDSLRCSNEYVERLLSPSSQLRIGDTTFTYNFGDSTMTLLDHTSGTSTTMDIDPMYVANKTSWACNVNRRCTRRGTYKRPWRIKMSKVSRTRTNAGLDGALNPLDYSRVYFNFKHYRRNTLGIWKNRRNTLNSKIPSGYEFRAERFSGTAGAWSPTQLSDIVYTNHEWKATNQSSHTWDLNPDGIPTKKNLNYTLFCIKKWERHTNAVNNDYSKVFNHNAW